MRITTHKDLKVWQKSIELVILIYKLTKKFPAEELYSLTNQMRRCAASIPANIAEGSGRKGQSEFIHFIHISMGSASELETFLIISERLQYITKEEFTKCSDDLTEIIRMLAGLKQSLQADTTRSL